MKSAQKSFNRLKEILKLDKEQLSETNFMQIKSDIYDTLKNYFEISINDINLTCAFTEQNKYKLEINLICDRIKKNRVYF